MLDDLTVVYGTGPSARTAVNGVSLRVPRGTVVGLVGESGSGKSTVARAIVSLAKPAGGRITIDDQDLRAMTPGERARHVQMIFQDPMGSLNPRMTVGEIIAEGLEQRDLDQRERPAEVNRLLGWVAMSPEVADSRPSRLSGGQRQRVAIARALGAQPDFILADEITSALDVSVQAQVLNVLRQILADRDLSVLFISHNLAVIRYISEYVAVMQSGEIVEQGPVEQVMDNPQHPTTRALIEAIPALS